MSLCDNTCEKQFLGRNSEDIPFMVGDYVYVRRAHEVVPALITGLPFSKSAGLTGDYTDDAYTANFIGYGHDHPFVPYVFPYIGKLTPEIKDALRFDER